MSKKLRIRFSKTGRAKYISHLDLMHTFQRAFVRAGIALRHSEGFNPHPLISIILPLSVGQESVCEYMDIEVENDDEDIASLPERLNAALPEGIEATGCREPEMKAKELVWLEVRCELIYDNGVSEKLAEKLRAFFSSESIVISKKSKHGVADADIAPMIKSAEFSALEGSVIMYAVIAAQNPSLNPSAMVDALRQLSPELCPDFARITRLCVYTSDMREFR